MSQTKPMPHLNCKIKTNQNLRPLEAFRSSFVVGNTECYMATLLIHRVSKELHRIIGYTEQRTVTDTSSSISKPTQLSSRYAISTITSIIPTEQQNEDHSKCQSYLACDHKTLHHLRFGADCNVPDGMRVIRRKINNFTCNKDSSNSYTDRQHTNISSYYSIVR